MATTGTYRYIQRNYNGTRTFVDATGTVSINSVNSYRIQNFTPTALPTLGRLIIDLPSTIDYSESFFTTSFRGATPNPAPIGGYYGLRDSSGNEALWIVNGNGPTVINIRDLVTPDIATGSIDYTQITQFVVAVGGSFNDLRLQAVGRQEILTLTGGTSMAPLTAVDVSPANLGDLLSYLNNVQDSQFVFALRGLQIGAADATYYDDEDKALILGSTDGNISVDPFGEIRTGTYFAELTINSTVATTINNFLLFSVYGFDINVIGSGDFTISATIINCNSAIFTTGSISRNSTWKNLGTIYGGQLINNILDGTYSWDGVSTISGEFIAKDTPQDYFIVIDSDYVSNDAELDVSDVVFDTPGTTHFLIDGVTGVEIVTAVAVTLTKTEINGGTATFVTPQPTLELTNLVEGSKIRVFVAGTTNEIAGTTAVSGTTFAFVTSLSFDVRIFKNGFRAFSLLNSPAPTNNQAIQINQLIDRAYNDP